MNTIHSITSNGRTLTAEVAGTELVIFLDGKRCGRFERQQENIAAGENA